MHRFRNFEGACSPFAVGRPAVCLALPHTLPPKWHALDAPPAPAGMTAEGQCRSFLLFIRVGVGIVLPTMASVYWFPIDYGDGDCEGDDDSEEEASEQEEEEEEEATLLLQQQPHEQPASGSKLQAAAEAAERALHALGGSGSLDWAQLLGAHALLWGLLWGAAQTAGW